LCSWKYFKTTLGGWEKKRRQESERGKELCVDRPVTVVALKRLGAGVFAVVPRQLVAPGESPLAALPRALVRLLTWGGEKNTFRKHA